MVATVFGVDALSVAECLRVRARAETVETGHSAGATHPALTAVVFVGLQVDANSSTVGLSRGAGALALAGATDLVDRARLIAGTTVFGAGEQVDADAAAFDLTIRTHAGPAHAVSPTCALHPTTAAVGGARLQIDALASTERLMRRTDTTALTLRVDTHLSSTTPGVALAAMIEGNSSINALPVTPVSARWAAAFAAHTILGCRTGDIALAAVRRITRQIDATRVAGRQSRAAVRRTDATRADLVGGTGRGAIPTILHVAAEIDADSVALGQSALADAIPAGTDLAFAARHIAVATVVVVTRQVHATPVAGREITAVGRAGSRSAHLVGVANQVASATVFRTRQGVDANAIAADLAPLAALAKATAPRASATTPASVEVSPSSAARSRNVGASDPAASRQLGPGRTRHGHPAGSSNAHASTVVDTTCSRGSSGSTRAAAAGRKITGSAGRRATATSHGNKCYREG